MFEDFALEGRADSQAGGLFPHQMNRHEVTPIGDELIQKLDQRQPFGNALFYQPQQFGNIVGQDGGGDLPHPFIVCRAQKLAHRLGGKVPTGKSKELIQKRLGVSHGTRRPSGDKAQGVLVRLHFFFFDDEL